MDNTRFAERLNRAMKLRNLSPGMLSIKTGLTDKMIRNYQRGKSQPSAYSASQLAIALGVSMDWLIGRGEEKDD